MPIFWNIERPRSHSLVRPNRLRRGVFFFFGLFVLLTFKVYPYPR